MHENQTDPDIPPSNSTDAIIITILSINDPPVLFASYNGKSLLHADATEPVVVCTIFQCIINISLVTNGISFLSAKNFVQGHIFIRTCIENTESLYYCLSVFDQYCCAIISSIVFNIIVLYKSILPLKEDSY